MKNCFLRTFARLPIALVVFVLTAQAALFAQAGPSRIRFIKGNIADKTAAVREGASADRLLALDAMVFANTYKTALGDDRDLDALAAAAVLAFNPDALASFDARTKAQISENLVDMFTQFSSETVRVSVLGKMAALKGELDTSGFRDMTDEFLQNGEGSRNDGDVARAALVAAGELGDGGTFAIVYDGWRDGTWQKCKTDAEDALVKLAEQSRDEINAIIKQGNVGADIRPLFDLLVKSEKISENFKSEVAENVLSETIYIADNSSQVTREMVALQVDALDIIVKNKWTRSSQTTLAFLELAEREYRAGAMSVEQFIKAVDGAAEIAPVGAARFLSAYLAELNRQAESGAEVQENVALAVIDALGNIGDRSSFDALLYVTYVQYPDAVISAARDALARLKW